MKRSCVGLAHYGYLSTASTRLQVTKSKLVSFAVWCGSLCGNTCNLAWRGQRRTRPRCQSGSACTRNLHKADISQGKLYRFVHRLPTAMVAIRPADCEKQVGGSSLSQVHKRLNTNDQNRAEQIQTSHQTSAQMAPTGKLTSSAVLRPDTPAPALVLCVSALARDSSMQGVR